MGIDHQKIDTITPHHQYLGGGEDIKMGDTAFGRRLATKKRELDAAADHYNRSERVNLRAKLDLMDATESAEAAPAADAPAILGDGQQEAI